MADAPELAEVLADARERAAILRLEGHPSQARSIEAFVDRVASCMRGYLTLLSDAEAHMRSGWSLPRLRSHFAEWQEAGFAFLDSRGRRRYCECIVPARTAREADRLAGQRGDSLSERRGA